LNNTISASKSFVAGESNNIKSVYSAIFGYSNTIESNCTYSTIFGCSNTIDQEGQAAFVAGSTATASHKRAVVFGYMTTSTHHNSLTCGCNNIVDSEALFTVGNGTQVKASNAFKILNDGSAWVSKNLTIGNSLILNSASYGSTLPSTGTTGQIFFKKA
jgi:hypothetical protein